MKNYIGLILVSVLACSPKQETNDDQKEILHNKDKAIQLSDRISLEDVKLYFYSRMLDHECREDQNDKINNRKYFQLQLQTDSVDIKGDTVTASMVFLDSGCRTMTFCICLYAENEFNPNILFYKLTFLKHTGKILAYYYSDNLVQENPDFLKGWNIMDYMISEEFKRCLNDNRNKLDPWLYKKAIDRGLLK